MKLEASTHNLEDGNAAATFPARDIAIFTEADLGEVCTAAGSRDCFWKRNRTVVIVTRPGLLPNATVRWHRAHPGIARLTPARGTLVVRGEVGPVLERRKVAILAEHRINDAWKDGARRRWTRRLLWARHSRMTARLIRRLVRRGYLVVAGGDLNVQPGRNPDGSARNLGYPTALGTEVGTRLDRLFASRPAKSSGPEYLDAVGSDHPRLVTTFSWPH